MPKRVRDFAGGLRIGLTQMSDFRLGAYQLGNEDLEEADEEADPSIFEIERSQAGDHSIWIDIMEELGGPFFGILNGDVSTPFRGDGSYGLKPNTPHVVNL